MFSVRNYLWLSGLGLGLDTSGLVNIPAIKRNLSKSAFSEGVGHFERKFWVDGDVARNPSINR